MSTNRFKKLGARHKARRRAVDLLFEAEARSEDARTVLGERVALARDEVVAPIAEYTHTLVVGVSEQRARLDDVIASHLHEWTLERLPAVDRAIMRVAIWELLYAVDVPEVVAVDEAVELAKELSTDDSPGFINGVLGHLVHIVPQLRAAEGQAAALAATIEASAQEFRDAQAAQDGADANSDAADAAADSEDSGVLDAEVDSGEVAASGQDAEKTDSSQDW
ncbi:transcription antitermination factor NusB [Hoyosella rhizosphaerae]|uniref:Transcription antitermination protein NusB n=1 Tax=Hoyosella rhizosphaerae TaxID=1755582 RepID=A0A916U4E0_9ACTN|nr:transcription antitermination factor NusB [Hoyosella rhizosphaerae]MBN4926452.1 transcription antitermination factor NusB [Hoyosella rhizosphaerae]GGC59232.1 hypothetical protein GCM10011410_09600 [Hoyosella rhizosphaerae]